MRWCRLRKEDTHRKFQSYMSHLGHQRKAEKTDRHVDRKLETRGLDSCPEKPQHSVSSGWFYLELNREVGMLHTAEQGGRVITTR